jgi:hypothetical protein
VKLGDYVTPPDPRLFDASLNGGELRPEVKQDTNFWNNLGAGGYSALNELTLGLPDFLVKNIGGQGGSKALEDLRKYHKTASDIGGTAGTLGSFLIPGGALVKGVGLGAKAIGAAKAAEKIGKAADFLKGGELTGNLAQKIGKGALRGAGQAAEQGIARGATNLDLTSPEAFQESLKQSTEALPGTVGVGALAGGTLGPLINKMLGRTSLVNKVTGEAEKFGETGARHGLNQLQESIDKGTLQSVGIETRGLRRAAQALGLNKVSTGGRYGDEYVNELAKAVRDTGITGKKGWQALLEKNDKQWNDIDEAFKASNPTEVWKPKLVDSFSKDPEIANFIQNEASDSKVAQDIFDETLGLVGKKASINDVRTKLSSIIRDNTRSSEPDRILKAKTAIMLKNKVDDFMAENSGKTPAEIEDAKKTYKLLQPFLAQESRNATALNKLFDVGPGTAEKIFGKDVTESALRGAGAGAILGGSQQLGSDQDVDLGQLVTSSALGALAGGVAKKAIPGIANKAFDSLGRGAGKILEKEKPRQVIEKAINSLSEASRAPAVLEEKKALGEKSEEDIPQLETPNPEESIQEGKNTANNTAIPLSPRLKTILGNKLNYIYENEYADQFTPEEFMDKVRKKTDNFSNQESLATFLFDTDKERESYIRQLNAYKELKDVDLDKALKGRGGLDVPLLGNIGGDEESGNAYDMLANAVLNLKNEGDLTKRTPAQEKQLQNTVKLLRKNPEMLPSFLQGTGLDFKQLKELGVI